MTVLKWVIRDPADSNPATNTYTFGWNPDKMSNPLESRTVTAQNTVAQDGQPIFWEGAPTPANWTFSGAIGDKAQYDALEQWVLNRKGRMWLTDHFGRRFTLVFKSFEPEPETRLGRYWFHRYTVTALVLGHSPATVGDSGPV